MATLEIIIRDDNGNICQTVRPRASTLTMQAAAARAAAPGGQGNLKFPLAKSDASG